MARAFRSPTVADFLTSLSRDEIEKISGAEVYKIVEFALTQELRVISIDAPARQLREAVLEWCAGALHDWDVLERSPWFYDFESEPSFVRQHVARLRQQVNRARREEELRQSTITEEELAELFEED